MAKRSKKKTKKTRALKRPGKDQRALVARLEAIQARLVPPAVQSMLRPARLSPEIPVLDGLHRQALTHTIALAARSKSIDQVARYILDTVPPVPLLLALRFFECVIAQLRRDVMPPGRIRAAMSLEDYELLVGLLQWFERRTRPDPPPAPGPADDYPGPLAQSAFAA